ncbi:MAG: hypothetical protein ACRDTF_04885 [Pseudonocardiaceae bacterium]
MTAQRHPSGHPTDERPRSAGKVVGAVLSGTVLVVGNLAALFFTVVAWLMIPSGPGDSSRIEGAWFTAFAGTVLAVVTALLTIVPVAARWLGMKWFIVPALLFALTLARWMYIDAVYPEEPDRNRYGSGQLPVTLGDGATFRPLTGVP